MDGYGFFIRREVSYPGLHGSPHGTGTILTAAKGLGRILGERAHDSRREFPDPIEPDQPLRPLRSPRGSESIYPFVVPTDTLGLSGHG